VRPRQTGESFVSAATNASASAISDHIAQAPEGWLQKISFQADAWLPWGAALGALAVQLLRPTNQDVSWLLTVNDRILAGATAYRDVIELNPPAAIWLYRLPALAAKAMSLRAEYVLAAMLALLIGAVLAYVRSIVTRYGLGAKANNGLMLGVTAFVLAILPLDEFAQREHFATIFIVPYAFVAIARIKGVKVTLADGLVSGLMLGLCVAIKPHFALCALLVCGFEITRARNIRAALNAEHWVAAAIALAYVAMIPIFYPIYLSDMAPKLSEVYLPLRLGLGALILRVAVLLAGPLAICWMRRDRRQDEGTVVLLLIAAGFLGAYLVQGKGWGYHAYPAIAFCIFAAGWAMQGPMREAGDGMRKLIVPTLLAASLLLPMMRFYEPDPQEPALAAAIERLAPHPKMLTIAFPLRLGHPLTRDVGGTWVGRTWGLWASGGAFQMKARAGADPVLRAKAEAYFEEDRRMLAQDIETQRPDIVLVEKFADFDMAAWIAQTPRLQAALEGYDLADTVGDVQILRLRDRPAA
jgi:hypothetical protein